MIFEIDGKKKEGYQNVYLIIDEQTIIEKFDPLCFVCEKSCGLSKTLMFHLGKPMSGWLICAVWRVYLKQLRYSKLN